MAQVVRYYEDNVTFTEGPFVIVNINGWRIEVELKGHHYPVLPSSSIFEIMGHLGFHGKTDNKELPEMVCDRLNMMVRTGEIVLTKHGTWVAKEAALKAQARAQQILDEVD